jgi:hypothetical protein
MLTSCAGCYVLEGNVRVNGQPLWKNKEETFWLFSTPMGRWAIAGADVRDEGFVRSSGWIYQEFCHEGLMPDRSSSRWLLFNYEESIFSPDAEFQVTIPMQEPDRKCEVVRKSQKQHASCKPRFVIDALWLLFKRRQ